MVKRLKWALPLLFAFTTVNAAEEIDPREGLNASNVEVEAVSVRKSQIHLRFGMLTGSFSGTFEGDFEVPAAVDVDYELFVANDGSVVFRFLQGLDNPDSIPFYTYAGTGYRYYWNSKGPSTIQKGDGLFIESIPRVRYYLGMDLGIAQVLVKSFGPNVQSVANMLDAGINVGAIYQLNKNFGLEAQGGYSVGYGISSTPVNGNTQRLLLGGSYYF